MSEWSGSWLHVRGEWARIWMFRGPGRLGLYRSYSLPTRSASLAPGWSPVPAKTHDDGSTITMSAFTGLQVYMSPMIVLSGRGTGGECQSDVASAGSVGVIGSSLADL